jgi:hypothetical protein
MEVSKTISVKYALNNGEDFSDTVKIYNYSERSIAIQMNEHFGKAFTEEFIKINGKFNPKLKIGAGWVFSNNKLPVLEDLLNKINSKEIKGVIPKIYPKSNVGPTGPVANEPDIVSLAKNMFITLSNKKDSVEVFTGPDQTFIWGENSQVQATVQKMNKSVFVQFNTSVKSIVICIP